jgi:hypothetical protein
MRFAKLDYPLLRAAYKAKLRTRHGFVRHPMLGSRAAGETRQGGVLQQVATARAAGASKP